MKLKSITIENLFGYKDPYTLDLLPPEGVRILHAQNGVGKTTVLSMVNAVVFVDIAFLDSTPFKSACLKLEDGSKILVEKKTVFGSVYGCTNIYSPENSSRACSEDHFGDEINEIKYTIETGNESPASCVINPFIRDEYQRERLILSDVRSNTGMLSGFLFNVFDKGKDFTEKYIRLTREIYINFIKADRLYVNTDGDETRFFGQGAENRTSYKEEAILACARDLKRRIDIYKRRKEDVSERLDRTFPKRVIEIYKSGRVLDDGIIRAKIKKIDDKSRELMELGLLSHDKKEVKFSQEEVFPEGALPVLDLYLEDTLEKLSTYDRIKEKISLLLSCINENGFTGKRLVIDSHPKDDTMPVLKFVSHETGREIPLVRLSSGEKHALILFYRLIFNSRRGSLVMVDEPEISLHISWQQRFISALISACKLNNLHAIVATHSPDIVSDHWDLLVNLRNEDNEDDEDDE